MAQEKITYVRRDQKTSKAGKPFTSLSLKVESKGDRFISGFGNKGNEHWKVGDSVNIIIEEKGQYLNFTMAESKKGEELAQNMKIDQVYNAILDTKALVIALCKAQGVPTGYEDIQRAREAHNAKLPVNDAYTSKGADGEPEINIDDMPW